MNNTLISDIECCKCEAKVCEAFLGSRVQVEYGQNIIWNLRMCFSNESCNQPHVFNQQFSVYFVVVRYKTDSSSLVSKQTNSASCIVALIISDKVSFYFFFFFLIKSISEATDNLKFDFHQVKTYLRNLV